MLIVISVFQARNVNAAFWLPDLSRSEDNFRTQKAISKKLKTLIPYIDTKDT